MRRIPTILVLLAVATVFPVHAADSLCSAAEQTFFSCPVADTAKIVSVCGAKNTSASKGYLQYRFGLPGQIEFEYPTNRSGSTKLFWWESQSHFDSAENWVWFRSGDSSYSLFLIEDRGTPDAKSALHSGVLVEKKGDPAGLTTLQCSMPATGDFKRLADILDKKEQTE